MSIGGAYSVFLSFFLSVHIIANLMGWPRWVIWSEMEYGVHIASRMDAVGGS